MIIDTIFDSTGSGLHIDVGLVASDWRIAQIGNGGDFSELLHKSIESAKDTLRKYHAKFGVTVQDIHEEPFYDDGYSSIRWKVVVETNNGSYEVHAWTPTIAYDYAIVLIENIDQHGREDQVKPV